MIRRRDVVMGGASLAAAGAAYALKPRREVRLLPDGEEVGSLVPMQVANWSAQDIGDPYALNQEGSLAARLYNQMVSRLYLNAGSGAQVMVLLAYGAKQNDDLQLHRPEVCYPAFGYDLRENKADRLTLSGGAVIPIRRLIAEREDESQYIAYWSRLGEFLPQDGGEQRTARFRNALQGIVPDGMLCRFSMAARSPADAWAALDGLVGDLLTATRADRRAVFIGTQLAKASSRRAAG